MMNMWIKKLLLLLLSAVPLVAMTAPLKVVATSSSVGMLVTEIAGEHAKLTVLAPPDRDIHYLQAKPSMIRALRSADLLVAVGAELEVGWLPVAVSSAANPKINSGQPGYFEAAAQVSLLDVGVAADRSLGDVHPAGNPHINTDPVRMAQVGHALAERLAQMDEAHANEYRERAKNFTQKVEQHLAGWIKKTENAPGALLYHKDIAYLLDRLKVPTLGLIEPVPGIPPTASHLKNLSQQLQDKKGVILLANHHSPQASKSLAKTLGWNVVRLPLDPPLKSDSDVYLAHIERWVDAIATTN